MNRPLVWVALAWSAGTLLASLGLIPGIATPIAICIAGAVSPYLVSLASRYRPWTVAISFIGVGALLWNVHASSPHVSPLIHLFEEEHGPYWTVEGRVANSDLYDPQTPYYDFMIDVTTAKLGERRIPVRDRVIVRWSDPDMQVHPGDTVGVFGEGAAQLGVVNHGIRDYEDYLRTMGVSAAIEAQGSASVDVIEAGHWWQPRYAASRLRSIQAVAYRSVMPDSVRAFVQAVWLGERSGVARDEYEDYILSGTAHILSVSGVHVGIVSMTMSAFLGLLGVRQRIRGCATMIVALSFALMAGGSIPSLRAAIMICMYVLADLLEREPDAPTALSISAILFLGWQPTLVYDTAFLLSFLSVASLLLFADPFTTVLERVPFALRQPIAACIAVQILPMPVSLRTFHILPIASPIANLIVIPLLTIALWLSFMASISVLVSHALASMFGYALIPIVYLIRAAASLAAAAGEFMPMITTPTIAAMALFWAASIALYVAMRDTNARLRWAAAASVFALLACLFWRPLGSPPEIDFLDVGHGDSTLIRTVTGETIVVDAGDRNEWVDYGKRVVAPALWARGLTRIDCLVITHADRDHIGGARFLVSNFTVGAVVLGPFASDQPMEAELVTLCAEQGVPIRRVARDDVITIGNSRLDVLHPPRDWPRGGKLNDDSLVLAMNWRGLSMLLAGDIEAKSELALRELDGRAEILKVPHHGADTSSTAGFIEAVQPTHAIVSTGARGRTVVDEPIVHRYLAHGAAVYRTDRMGGIQLTMGEQGLKVESARMARGYPTTTATPESR